MRATNNVERLNKRTVHKLFRIRLAPVAQCKTLKKTIQGCLQLLVYFTPFLVPDVFNDERPGFRSATIISERPMKLSPYI